VIARDLDWEEADAPSIPKERLGIMVGNYPLTAAPLTARPVSPKPFSSLSGKCLAAFLEALLLGIEKVNC
jgi:hypothetical protein